MKSIADIQAIKENMAKHIFIRDNKDDHVETRIVVGMDDCGIAAGADKVFDAMIEYVASRGVKNTRVYRSGCMGRCDLEPTVEVYVPGQPKVTYVNVDIAKAAEIVDKHIVGGNPVAAYTVNA